MKILGIFGSLRGDSINTTLLLAAARLAPPNVEVALYEGLGELAPFNPDMALVDTHACVTGTPSGAPQANA